MTQSPVLGELVEPTASRECRVSPMHPPWLECYEHVASTSMCRDVVAIMLPMYRDLEANGLAAVSRAQSSMRPGVGNT